MKRFYGIVFYPAFDSKPGQVVIICLRSENYLSSGGVHRQVIVARLLVFHGSVLVLKFVNLDGKEDVAHNCPQVYTPLGVAAAAGERHKEGLVVAPIKAIEHGRLEQGIDPLDLLRVGPDGSRAGVIGEQVAEAVCAVFVIFRVAQVPAL
jgi:hypothetical protein